MGLFGVLKGSRERRRVKSAVDKLMKQYDKRKIDSGTYLRKMMELSSSQKKR